MVQKYRELKEEFDDVGLMTGDTVGTGARMHGHAHRHRHRHGTRHHTHVHTRRQVIAPESGVLVMTTEILRDMLYRVCYAGVGSGGRPCVFGTCVMPCDL